MTTNNTPPRSTQGCGRIDNDNDNDNDNDGDASFVAGDWGTSHLRLVLCAGDGRILERAAGPGAADARGRFAPVLHSLLAPWQQRHGPLPTLLCGMVGSSIGWLQTPYIPCPALPEQIVAGCVSPDGGSVHIVPGLSCRNRFDAPDFMRGEETQILGAMRLDPSLRRGRRLLCLPGTHTKWVLLADGVVQEFLTALTGELFALLRDHSVLLRDGVPRAAVPGGSGVERSVDVDADVNVNVDAGADGCDAAAFEQGLAQSNQFPQAQLLHRLFECRARRLDGELSGQASAAFLSGLLIGSDIVGALQLLAGTSGARSVHLIGAVELTRLYAIGLATHEYTTTCLDGVAASVAGLSQLHGKLIRRQVADAAR
jgi:2-dehydro-3-deoxygalactonokinase